jgi:hypothetical protein
MTFFKSVILALVFGLTSSAVADESVRNEISFSADSLSFGIDKSTGSEALTRFGAAAVYRRTWNESGSFMWGIGLSYFKTTADTTSWSVMISPSFNLLGENENWETSFFIQPSLGIEFTTQKASESTFPYETNEIFVSTSFGKRFVIYKSFLWSPRINLYIGILKDSWNARFDILPIRFSFVF